MKTYCIYTCNLIVKLTSCIKQTFLLRNIHFYGVHHSLKRVLLFLLIGNLELKWLYLGRGFLKEKVPTFWRPFKIVNSWLKAEITSLDCSVGNPEYSGKQCTDMQLFKSGTL